MESIKKILLSALLLLACVLVEAQQVNISGIVKSKTDGEAIIGASVIEKGTSNGTATDINGNFKLSVKKGATIVISYVGYKPVSLVATPSINVLLEENTKIMDEVVVTGYMTQRKADLTGAVSVVNMKDVAKQNENNPIKALQGRLPGVTISADGNPSGSASVRVRGITTLNDNDPLYIIDGVPTKSGMHELNGNDIESIQVLKDASAASIYGSRAAAGVIIVTTKRGQSGKVRINFDGSVAASLYQSKVDMLNTEEYGKVMWQAYVNSNTNPNSNNIGYVFDWGYNKSGTPVLNGISLPKYLDSANTLPTSDTDWFNKITRTGFAQKYDISMSNGNEKGNYYFSLGYYNNDGLIKYTNFKRYSARMNGDYKLLGDILTVGEHFTLNRTTEHQAPTNILADAIQALPIIPVNTADGTGWGGPTGAMPDRHNPYRIVYDNRNNQYTYWRVLGDAYINLHPLKGLNIKGTFGLDYANKYQRNFTLPYTEGYLSSDVSAVTIIQEHFIKYMANLVATYDFKVGQHSFNTMLGIEFNKETDNSATAYAEGFDLLTPDYMWPDAATGDSKTYGSQSTFSLLSYFGKVNYDFAGRYLASLTLRRDGSSRFGKNNRFGTFPAASFGWRISEEPFMRNTKDIISNLKLCVAWGQTGNQEFSNNGRYSLFITNYGTSDPTWTTLYGTAYDITGSNGGSTLASGYKRVQLGNENLKWETTTQTNIGLDFELFNRSVYGSAEWYFKKTTDILQTPSYIATIGEGGSRTMNCGSMENKGVEISLGYRNKTNFGLEYDVTGNLSTYRNKITYVPDEVATSGDYGGDGVKSIIGHALGSRVGYIADGLFKTQEEVDNAPAQEGKGIGRIRYRDIDGNGVVNSDDQDWIMDPTPSFSYGLNIYLKYKNIDFTMFWQGVQGVDVYNSVKASTDFWSVTETRSNKGSRLLDAWTPENYNSTIPAVSFTDDNNEGRTSTYYVENGSFLKLRTIQLAYTLPKSFTNKLKMENFRLYISAQNLLTIKSSKFTGEDPENPSLGYPIPLNLTFGFNIGF